MWQFSLRTMMFAIFVIAAGVALARLGYVAAAWCIVGALCGSARPKQLPATMLGGALGAAAVCYTLYFLSILSAKSFLDFLWLGCPFVPGAMVGALVWLFRALCQEALEFWRSGVPPDHLR
jgi:hypothetical protein